MLGSMESQLQTGKQGVTSSRRPRLWRVVILSLFSYGLASFLLSFLLLAPPSRAIAIPLSSLETGLGVRLDSGVQARIERVDLDLSEGIRIPVWLGEPAPDPVGCVLLFHGRGGCHSLDRMRFVLTCGYAVLAPDFRAHGEAQGELSGFGYLEQAEVRATLALARQRWPKARVVTWGRSMGAVAILFAAEETATLAGHILESPYSTLERAFENRFEQKLPRWLVPLTYGPVLVAQFRSGLWIDEIQPIREIVRFPKDRVLLVQGREDTRVQMDEYEAFIAALPGVKGLVLEGIGHAEFFRSGGVMYRTTVRKQLATWLQR
jgi:uncharacterized protein